jgi:hypothetical protein
MTDFWTGFLANLSSDALLAIALYFILTQPGERKRAAEAKTATLGLLKAELITNHSRARSYIKQLARIDKTLMKGRKNSARLAIADSFPLRFTRGAWNALREGGFLPGINNPFLVLSLFSVNERTVVANRTLRRFELVTLKNEPGDPRVFAKIAALDVKKLLTAQAQALSAMKDIEAGKTGPPVSDFDGQEDGDDDLHG